MRKYKGYEIIEKNGEITLDPIKCEYIITGEMADGSKVYTKAKGNDEKQYLRTVTRGANIFYTI